MDAAHSERRKLTTVALALVMIALAWPLAARSHAVTPGPDAGTGADQGSCARVVRAARDILAADDAVFLASKPATARAVETLRRAIDRVREPLLECRAADIAPACESVVATARQIVAAKDAYDRAETRAAEAAALAQLDPAIAQLDVHLTDCRAGSLPDPCTGAVELARKVILSEDKLGAARTKRARKAALLAQDRAIQGLAFRIGTCQASGAAFSCPDILVAGAAVADAEDDFHNAPSDDASDAALEAEVEAIEALRPAVSACTV